jgi:hypothetical protein
VRDYDFHPGEETVRCFGVPIDGLLANDHTRCVYQTQQNGVVLRHYAFSEEWFKLNITFDLAGQMVETGSDSTRFAVNCDIATPMRRVGSDISAVDLFLDVLVHSDGLTYTVVDEDEFAEARSTGLISPSEAAAAVRGLDRLIGWIGSGRLGSLMAETDPRLAAQAPAPLPFQRAPLSEIPSVMPGRRPTWGEPPESRDGTH